MKIILFNRTHNNIGGDRIQIENYIKSLNKLGHEAIYSPAMFNVPTGDEHWLFHINFGWVDNQVTSLKNQGKEYILFAIFYPHIYDNSIEKMRDLISGSKFTVCLSEAEKNEMMEFLNCKFLDHKIKVIGNGIDKEIFNPSGEVSGDDCVLSVGRFEDAKGLKEVVRAARIANKPVKIIGTFGDKQYQDEIIADGVEVYSEITQEELAKHYRSARVYVCCSESERYGLTLIEAYGCGANVISSPGNRGNEWFGDTVIIDPQDSKELASAINVEWDKHPTRSEFKVYSWDEIVQQILNNIQ
jgi:glycosyltransferase involved in cell wall biosynthesis